MYNRIWKQATAVIVSLTLICAMLPLTLHTQQAARAATSVRTISPGISQIASPSQSGTAWSGDYIYFGHYKNSPIKWRVLDKTGEAGSSSAQGGLLMQSDQILDTMAFEDGTDTAGEHQGGTIPNNRWSASDIRAWLQGGDSFLSSSNFTELEKNNILETTTSGTFTSPLNTLSHVGLNHDTMFLLDAGDLANTRYGYRYNNGLTDGSTGNYWWLRSAHSKFGDAAGYMLSGGYLFYTFTSDDEGGVVPAFNLKQDSILFSSAAGQPKSTSLAPVTTSDINEWKLTILDESQTVSVNGTVKRAVNSNQIRVPYTYSGTGATQLSIMITDGAYTGNNTTIKYYGRISADIAASGTAEFTLPDNFNQNTDRVYLFAEQVNGGRETDYASRPAEVTIHEHQWSLQYDDDGHWYTCTQSQYDIDPDAVRDYGEHIFGEDEDECALCGYTLPDEPDEPDEPEEPEDPGEGDESGEEDDGEDDTHVHQWNTTIIKPATCTKDGLRQVFCTLTDEDCNVSYIEAIPALSAIRTHTFGEWIQTTAPTTEREGQSKRTCIVCGVSETQAVAKLHKHKYDEDEYLSNEKLHWNQCSCGKTKNADYHTWNKGKILKTPTSKLEGEILYHCTVCDQAVKRTLAKTGASFSKDLYQYKVQNYKNGIPAVTVLGFAKGKSAKTVNIPKTVTLNGARYTVTAIAPKAFIRNEKIQQIILSDSMETLGDLAFFRAANVEKITIGTGLKNLGDHTFCHMTLLKTVMVKSKKLRSTDTNIFHAAREFTIRVPKKKVEQYQRNVFYAYPQNVQAIKK